MDDLEFLAVIDRYERTGPLDNLRDGLALRRAASADPTINAPHDKAAFARELLLVVDAGYIEAKQDGRFGLRRPRTRLGSDRWLEQIQDIRLTLLGRDRVRLVSTMRYGAFRAQLEHEDDLLGVRVGWLIASEAFLFAAYAATLVVPDKRFIPAAGHLFKLLPILGIVISALVLTSVVAGMFAARRLRERCPTPSDLPLPVGSRWTHNLGLVSPLFMPVVIATAWALLL